MSLDSNHLDAFLHVVRLKHFFQAAHALHITQSALSQRIQKLEESIGAVLLIRERSGVRLTSAGEALLQVSQIREAIEADFLNKVKEGTKGLAGELRIGSYASITRSAILPCLSQTLLKNPLLQLNLAVRELRDLPHLLKTGEIDYMFLDHEYQRQGIKAVPIGFEEYVLVESAKVKTGPKDLFLNHDEDDTITFQFFALQSKKTPPIRRAFLDEIYSVLDGVALGIGRSVLPRQLVGQDPRIHMVPGYRPLRVPVVFHYREQVIYTQQQKTIIELFSKQLAQYFSD